MSLQGQVAIITGASSGLGKELAVHLHDAGMKVVLTARRADRLEELSKQLEHSLVVTGDVLDESLPQRLIDAAVEKFGRCDVVFNGAGLLRVATVEETDIDEMCHMVRVNVEAATRMAYTAVKFFKKQNSGHLVNVSSILGTKVRPTAGVYAGTKYAIEAISEALRMELAGTNVKLSVLEPGIVMTELHNTFKVHPTKAQNVTKPLVPADIARCVKFLLDQPDHVRIPVMMVLPGEQSI